MKPLRAKKVELTEGGTSFGYGIHGASIGASVMVRLVGVDGRTTEAGLRKRIEKVLREHLDEIVEVAPLERTGRGPDA